MSDAAGSGLRRRALLRASAVAASACAVPAIAAPATASVVLASWVTLPAEAAALDHLTEAFTQATGIVVRKERIADKYMDVIRSRFAARNTPDLMYLDSSEAPLLIRSGVLEPMDAAVDDAADYYPQFLQAFRGGNGRLYGVPKDYSTLALYSNTRWLRAAGMQAGDLPRDFDALFRLLPHLQARLPKGVAALIVGKDLARHLSAIEAYGLPAISADGWSQLARIPGAQQYLDGWVQGRRQRHIVSPGDDLGADSPGAAFGTGRTALMIEGNWVLSALRGDYADVPFAVHEQPRVNGRAQTMAFVGGLSIPRFAANKAAALELARYLTQAGMQEWSRRSGTLPSRRSVQAALAGSVDPALQVHMAGAEYATVWSRGTSLPVVNANFGNQFLAALNGSKSVAQAMAHADRAANREIERQQ
ncbi:extracellular solute-binding protein [Pseudorhodoferax sp. Leaf274]|uniref:extracellular solute-binding protein n=1 Tax=Pseudorhodoferax sp. Leaf274 TaxID=1736318 RepID=UPI000702E589|nr:extracellular solute-binding protein [Pseudorhodoferax sp. Leaf274]KQP38925.1 hypothetical protein ASF44_10840 [Pseudorhodoferax sp. Leaf274]